MEVKRLSGLGVPGVILFGLPRPEDKDPTGSAALRPDGITQRALAAVRDAVGDSVVVMADCCLDEFTDHGHCGVIDPATGDVDNDATLDLYAELAVSQAAAGADVIAPSGMMDGQVGAIRGRPRRRRATEARPSWPTRPSTPRRSTARSARRRP